MSDFTIEQLEALKEGITPGPWEATKDDILRAGWRDRLLKKCPWYAEDEGEDEISYMASSDEFVLSNPESHYKPLTDNRADMELVASAPELLDALIAEKQAHQETLHLVRGLWLDVHHHGYVGQTSVLRHLTRILEATDE